MKINGVDYALFTTESSLPSFFAPAALGNAGQILSCTSAGLTWINQVSNTDYQVTQSGITQNNDYRIILKKTANDTAETTYVNFASTLTYNPSTKKLKVNS
jgi:phage protein U